MAINTSSSNIASIDADYPRAGQDNDSQGFRDNFTKVKDELTNAHADLTALDTNTVKNNDAITNMQGNTINNVVITQGSQKFYSGGVLSSAGVRPVSYEIATYHSYTINSTGITLQLADWPTSGKYAEVLIELRGRSQADTVTFDTENSGSIKVATGFAHPATIDDNIHPYIYRFWTIDGGQTVYGEYLGEFDTVL
jgi:hypothetical protein|tara:strand:- start:225 stop:812 length:588 start_codon:yes stop_codon:yes gene_type:complete